MWLKHGHEALWVLQQAQGHHVHRIPNGVVTAMMTDAERTIVAGLNDCSLQRCHSVPACHPAVACIAGPHHNCWGPAGLLLSPDSCIPSRYTGDDSTSNIPGGEAAWGLQQAQGCHRLQPIWVPHPSPHLLDWLSPSPTAGHLLRRCPSLMQASSSLLA